MNSRYELFFSFLRISAFGAIVMLNFAILARFLLFHQQRRKERREAKAQRSKLVAERRSKATAGGHRGESSSDGEYAENSPRASASAGRLKSKAE